MERREGSVAVHHNHASIAADVAQDLVVRTRDDGAAVAAHQSELRVESRGRSWVVPRVRVAGARRGVDGVRIGGGNSSGGGDCGGGGVSG